MDGENMEVELKLSISNKKELQEKLIALGAVFVSDVTQTDYLYNVPSIDFEKTGEAFRLRHEVSSQGVHAYLTYKGKAAYSPQGHKQREEYEVEVSDFSKMKHMFELLHFQNVLTIEKHRMTYYYDEIIIALDTLSFGDFIELEGDAEKGQELREKLNLGNIEAITKSYFDLLVEYTNNK